MTNDSFKNDEIKNLLESKLLDPIFYKSKLTAGISEEINSRIQEIKRRAKGYKNIKNFIVMIYLEGSNLILPAFC